MCDVKYDKNIQTLSNFNDVNFVVLPSSETEGRTVATTGRGRGGGRNQKPFNSYRNLALQDDSVGYMTVLVDFKGLNCVPKAGAGQYRN